MTDLQKRPYVPAKQLNSPYPLIDSDPHFKRVVKYARTSDYVKGAAFGAFGPGLMLLWERIAPSHVAKGGFASVMRLSCTIGAGAGFIYFYTCSIQRFYGMEENKREVEMDMREMHGVDTAKYYRQAERELAAGQAETPGST
ncbi:hypothetical protein P7C71_g3801, partial [Lecanoromycetidae sp. Uapishka_2]